MKHEHYVTNDMPCNLIGRTLQGAVHNYHVRFLPDPFLVAKGAGPQTSSRTEPTDVGGVNNQKRQEG